MSVPWSSLAAPPMRASPSPRCRRSLIIGESTFRASHEQRGSRSMSPTVTLVTGSSGFVGRVVMQRLAAAGHRAVGLDPVSAATTGVHDDLSDRGRLRELLQRDSITHIIHAGGVAGPMVVAGGPAGGVGHQRDRALEPA